MGADNLESGFSVGDTNEVVVEHIAVHSVYSTLLAAGYYSIKNSSSRVPKASSSEGEPFSTTALETGFLSFLNLDSDVKEIFLIKD